MLTFDAKVHKCASGEYITLKRKSPSREMIQAWFKKLKNSIEVYYILTDSSDLNLDEYLNHMLKQDIHSGVFSVSKEGFHKKTYFFVRGLQNSEKRMKKIINHEKVSYNQKFHA